MDTAVATNGAQLHDFNLDSGLQMPEWRKKTRMVHLKALAEQGATYAYVQSGPRPEPPKTPKPRSV